MTTTPLWDRHQGDDDTIDVALDGVEDLVGIASIRAEVAFKLDDEIVLTAAVTDAVEREVHVTLTPWLATAELGDWRFVIKVVPAGHTEPITWPERGHAIIRVHGPR